MKTAEMPVLKKPTKLEVTIDPRLRESIEIVCALLQAFQSGSRDRLRKLAEKQGYTDDEVSAAVKYLVETPVSEAVAPVKEATQLSSATFDPHEAGLRMVEQLKGAEGGAWTGHELQKHFKLIPATLHRRRKEYRIVYWRDAQHNFHYPKWQFNASGALLAGIQEVLETLKSQDEWRVMRYFLGKRDQLEGLRPLDLLRKGEVEEVLAHTKTHVEENTW